MSDAHSAVGGVHTLAARPTGAVNVDAKIVGINLDFHIFGFWQDSDGGGGGVDATLRFGFGHALHPVDARFVFEATISALAPHLKDDFLVAADATLVAGQHLIFPAAVLGVVDDHAKQVCGEEPCFVAPGPGPNFDDDIFLIARIFRKKQGAQLLDQLLLIPGQLIYLGLGQLLHLGVVGQVQ